MATLVTVPVPFGAICQPINESNVEDLPEDCCP